MNLNDLFELSFAGRPDAAAIEFFYNGRLKARNFSEMDSAARRMAWVLAHRGLRSGDRLCVYLPNCIELIEIYLACVKLGLIFVPINILYRDREMSHILEDAEPKAVVVSDLVEASVPVWLASELAVEAACAPLQDKVHGIDGDTPAAIVYTSGTTGKSKGAILTHNNLASNALNLLTCWRIDASDRLLMPLPLFHVHGLGNGLHCWLISGCHMRLYGKYEQARAAEWFHDYRPTLFFGVPTMYVRMLEFPEAQARVIGGFVRLFVSGSAPLPSAVLEEFRVRFGHTILERYGMTETLMNISNPYTGERRAGTVGLPLPGISVRIQSGELYVRGPNVFAGYWRQPDATAAAFVDGYFRTGDLAVQSEDGYYTLQGRRSDLIISGGFNIYPREIEEYLLEQEGVSEAAVVGVPDRTKGEVPIAYVVCTEVTSVDALRQRCRANLASFKVPKAFVPVKSLPRTALGKVQKHLLPQPEMDSEDENRAVANTGADRRP